jgi:uncharacterized SAM-binding protein YcdF (DUF218 family)
LIYLHKLLPLLFSPIFLVMLLLVVSLFTKRSRITVVTAITLLYCCSLPLLSERLIQSVEGNQVKRNPQEVPRADAIVVLGGSIQWVSGERGLVPEWGDADRFFAGLDLMDAGRAPYLVFTGGKVPWDLALKSEGHVLKQYAERFGVAKDKIHVTADVHNTAEEALAVQALLRNPPLGIKAERDITVILVTSAFHMRRASSLFEQVGLTVIPYAVDFKVPATKITPMSFLPSAGALSTTDGAVREMLGVLYYKVRHMLSY